MESFDLGGMTQGEVLRLICSRLGSVSATRRIGPHHVAALRAVANLGADAAEVNVIYKALVDADTAMVMSKLYRVLKVLEESGLLERHWHEHHGRARSVYRIAGRDGGVPDTGFVCSRFGTPGVAPRSASVR